MTGPALPLPEPPLTDDAARVRLRPWRDDPGDVAGLVAAWHDPHVVAHNPVPRDASPEAARRWIAGEAERRARGLALDLVVAPVAGDEVWGEVGLRGFDGGVDAEVERAEVERADVRRADVRRADVRRADVRRADVRRAEVGWWLAPEARGRGVAAVALDLLATWALGPPLQLRQVWARIDPANEASARVASAAGFRRLGVAGGADVWARDRSARAHGRYRP